MSIVFYRPDVSDELRICSKNNGFRFIRPRIDNKRAGDLGYTVKELLQLPFNVIFLDKNSSILKINDNNVLACGFDSSSHALGKTINDTYHRDAAKFSIAHDTAVLKTNNLLIKEEMCERIDSVRFSCLTAKLPWYNDAGDLSGVIGLSISLGLQNKYEISDALNALADLGIIRCRRKERPIPSIINDVTLTKREIECLELIDKGMTAKRVAEKLNLSKRTIEGYFENIKNKLGVRSKYDLINLLTSIK